MRVEAEGLGLLRAVGCRIHMVGVSCSNNEAPGGLIQIQNGSELFVQNSTFMNNGDVSSTSSVISATFNSSLFISDSLFSGNADFNGACLWLHHNVSVNINQSTFMNNTAVNGGVIYQNREPENVYGQNHSYKHKGVDRTHSDLSGEGETHQSLYIHDSYFGSNKAMTTGGVVYLYGDFIRFFLKKCSFTKNKADDGGAIYKESFTGTLVLQQCLFTNNSASVRGNSLSLYGTHSQLIDCEFYGDISSLCFEYECSNMDFQYVTSFINNCTFSEQVYASIKASGTKLNITDSRWYNRKSYCLYLDNSDSTIVGSHFAADADIVFDDRCSNLTVINTSFVNGYSVFNTNTGNERVEFIDCLFYTSGILVLKGKTLLKNCTIRNFEFPFIFAYLPDFPDFAFCDSTVSDQLEIVDSVIMENRVSDDQPFIYVGNVSFTMSNCLYTGNVVRNHILLNGTTDVTITNVTFLNNSFGGIDDLGSEKPLLTVNNTVIKINDCTFKNNNLRYYASLMFVRGSCVTVINTVMSDNYKTNYTRQELISIHDSKTIEFSSSKFINNSNSDIFNVRSLALLLIDSCSFENYGYFYYFDIWNTYDVILQRSTFYTPSIGVSDLNNVNNVRIFRCTFSTYGYDSSFFIQSYFYVTTKVFLLDSDITLEGSDTTIVTEGSPYASGWY